MKLIDQWDSRFFFSMAFSPDGNVLEVSDRRSTTLWNVNPRKWITDTDGEIAFSQNGNMIASSKNFMGIIYLWDTGTGQPIGQPINGINVVVNMAFSPNGKNLAVSRWEDVILMDVDPESWITQSCERAGRNFTRDEWAQYGFTEPYRKTCDQWDLKSGPTPTP